MQIFSATVCLAHYCGHLGDSWLAAYVSESITETCILLSFSLYIFVYYIQMPELVLSDIILNE